MLITAARRLYAETRPPCADAAGAKRAANQGPVFITDRGRPAHVLLSIEAYRRLLGQGHPIADLLAMPGVEDLDLPLPHHLELARAADLS